MLSYTGKTIFIGIDVHKNSYSVSVFCDGMIIKRDTLVALPEVLVKYCQKFKGAHIKSAYEAGFCGFYLHRILIKHNIDNIVVHAASIEIGSRDAVKTDKRDSIKIATQLAAGRLSCVYIPSEPQENARCIPRLREQYVRHQRRVACQIKSLLHLRGIIKPNTKVRVNEKLFRQVSEMNLDKKYQFVFEGLVASWRHFSTQITVINKVMKRKSEEDKWLLDTYKSCPGLGLTSSLKLMNELHDMSQFSNEGKLASYAGLTPREHSSGGKVRQGHITRQGKPIIRTVLVVASWKAIKIDGELNAIFGKLSRKAGKKKAIVAVARILLLRIRTCIKEKRLYRIKDTSASASSVTANESTDKKHRKTKKPLGALPPDPRRGKRVASVTSLNHSGSGCVLAEKKLMIEGGYVENESLPVAERDAKGIRM